MSWVKYTECLEAGVEQTLQTSYVETLQQIRALGFHDAYAVCETHLPYSFFLSVNIAQDLSALGAVWRQGPMASLLVYFMLIIHEDGYAYATVLKDRVKFVTMFEDDTLIHTSAYRRYIRRSVREHKYIFQLCRTDSIFDAWEHHQRCVTHVAKPWNSVKSLLNLQTALQIEQRISAIQIEGEPEEREEWMHGKKKHITK